MIHLLYLNLIHILLPHRNNPVPLITILMVFLKIHAHDLHFNLPQILKIRLRMLQHIHILKQKKPLIQIYQPPLTLTR